MSGSSLVTTASLNNTFSYSFVVTNKGPQDASNAEFVDTLPAGVSYVSSASSAGTLVFTNGQLVCDFDTLTAGAFRDSQPHCHRHPRPATSVNVPEVETTPWIRLPGKFREAPARRNDHDFAVTRLSKRPRKRR